MREQGRKEGGKKTQVGVQQGNPGAMAGVDVNEHEEKHQSKVGIAGNYQTPPCSYLCLHVHVIIHSFLKN